mmetsp:Transcript_14945/g.45089  ORF Transcript_14945/g.45089 Transcript_14945/m.45089 type:complete len:230 (+) Transcript_14945:1454-2143(+)
MQHAGSAMAGGDPNGSTSCGAGCQPLGQQGAPDRRLALNLQRHLPVELKGRRGLRRCSGGDGHGCVGGSSSGSYGEAGRGCATAAALGAPVGGAVPTPGCFLFTARQLSRSHARYLRRQRAPVLLVHVQQSRMRNAFLCGLALGGTGRAGGCGRGGAAGPAAVAAAVCALGQHPSRVVAAARESAGWLHHPAPRAQPEWQPHAALVEEGSVVGALSGARRTRSDTRHPL